MATRSPKPTKAPQRKSVSLQVCIDELQLISSLADETDGKDPRLPQLVIDARADILDALDKIHHGDDLPEEKNAPRG